MANFCETGGCNRRKWRRQVPIGAYIVDFICFEHRLVVECDGFHTLRVFNDTRRDNWLRSQRFTIVRFWNYEILREREAARAQFFLDVACHGEAGRSLPLAGEGVAEGDG